ncbi:aspartate--tRNA(Asn) ligase [[Eubacterium] cellulosolvens]
MAQTPNNFKRSHYSTEITEKIQGKIVTILGWVENIRDLRKIQFITLRDKKGHIQITIPKKEINKDIINKAKSIKKQFVLRIDGLVKSSKEAPRGVEIIPSSIEILAESKQPLPLDPTGKMPADLDVRLDERILDLRRPECRAIFNIKNETLKSIRNYFVQHDYVEIQTPRIIGAAAEGGATLFSLDYFDDKAHLAQSPQLYKEELITVYEKVYEIGPFFRAEKSHTRRHLSEFISIDMEEAFATSSDVMNVQEELVAQAIKDVKKNCENELKILGSKLDNPQLPFKKYSYSDIIEQLSKIGFKVKWGEDLTTEACRELGKLHKGEFYFIIDWPISIRPFYIKPNEADPKISLAFDFMYEWIEITSGGSRVDSKDYLLKRLKEQGLDPKAFDFHLKIFDYGMPPHAGWGMGLDRFIMVLTSKMNLRDVVLFPRDMTRLKP